jgi:hypothetical protein
MELDKLQALPNILNRTLASAAFAGLLAYGAYNHMAVEAKIGSLIDHVNQVEMMGTKVTFDARRLDKMILPRDSRFVGGQAVADLTKLNGRLLARLLNVGTLSNLCLFDGPKAGLLDDVAADHRLRDLDLVEIKDAEDVRAEVLAKKDLNPQLGAPVRCYRMTMTARGYDVRSAIAYTLGAALSGEVESAPASEPSSAQPAQAQAAPAKPERSGAAHGSAERRVRLSQGQ